MLLVNLFVVCLTIGLGAVKARMSEGQWVTQGDWVYNKRDDTNIKISGSRFAASFKGEYSYKEYSLNALYLGIVANETNKRFYWEFNCVLNCSSVGIAKKSSYYDYPATDEIRGAFFGGNLHENDHCHVGNFGDHVTSGHRIGFILDAGEQELKIYIVQNDRPLGLAFVQKAPYASELYPAVIFHKPGTVEITERKNVNTDDLLVRGDYPEKGVRGYYKLVKVTEDGRVKDVRGYTLKLDQPNAVGHIPMDFHVVNYIGGLIMKVDKDAEGYIYSLSKRVKFNNQFHDLTITCKSGATMQFKRFIPKRPFENTTVLQA